MVSGLKLPDDRKADDSCVSVVGGMLAAHAVVLNAAAADALLAGPLYAGPPAGERGASSIFANEEEGAPPRRLAADQPNASCGRN